MHGTGNYELRAQSGLIDQAEVHQAGNHRGTAFARRSSMFQSQRDFETAAGPVFSLNTSTVDTRHTFGNGEPKPTSD